MRVYRATPEGRKKSIEAGRRHNAKPERKAKLKAYNTSDTHKASNKAWRETPNGQAYVKAYRVSEKRHAVSKLHYDCGKGKVSIARYQATEKGKANLARGVHKRRGLMQIQSTLTAAEWTRIKEFAEQRCHYCRKPTKRLTMDHVIPLSKGGHHVASNIVPACRSCNSRKGNRSVNLL
jgi:hypothetical protein